MKDILPWRSLTIPFIWLSVMVSYIGSQTWWLFCQIWGDVTLLFLIELIISWRISCLFYHFHSTLFGHHHHVIIWILALKFDFVEDDIKMSETSLFVWWGDEQTIQADYSSSILKDDCTRNYTRLTTKSLTLITFKGIPDSLQIDHKKKRHHYGIVISKAAKKAFSNYCQLNLTK